MPHNLELLSFRDDSSKAGGVDMLDQARTLTITEEQAKQIVEGEAAAKEAPPSPEFVAFVDYLASENGNALANRVMGFIEDRFKTSIEKNTEFATTQHYLKIGLIAIAIIVGGLLAYFDKFNSEIGILMGTVVGLLFGKKTNE